MSSPGDACWVPSFIRPRGPAAGVGLSWDAVAQSVSEADRVPWLEEWLKFTAPARAAPRRWPRGGGVAGGIAAGWRIGGARFAGRFATLKWGSRLFVACCRAKRENYDRIADDFF